MTIYSHRNTRFFLFSFLIIFLSQCKPDEVEDSKAPSVAFEQVNQELFFGQQDLTFKISDDHTVSDVQVFIDDALLSDEAVNIQSGNITLHWDSRIVTDGPHIIKVIVKDLNGNATEMKYDIVVKNTLLTITIPANYLTGFYSTYSEVWIFLSDASGNIIGTQQGHDDSIVKFPLTTVINTDKINLNFFYYGYNNNRIERRFETYTNVDLDNMILRSPLSDQIPDENNIATFSITDIPSSDYEFYPTNSSEYSFQTGGYISQSEYQFKSYILGNQTDIFAICYNPAGNSKYKLFNDVSPHDNIKASFNDFTDMHEESFTIPESKQFAYHFDIGHYTGSDTETMYNYYSNFTQPVSSLTSYYPNADVFDHYLSSSGSDNSYYLTLSDLPHNSFKTIDADVSSHSFSDNNLKISITGDVNQINAYSFHSSSNDTASISDQWNVFSTYQSSIDIMIPALPAEILNQYFNGEFTLQSFNTAALFKTTSSAHNYESMIKEMFFGEPVSKGYYENMEKDVILNNALSRDTGNQNNFPLYIFDRLPIADKKLIRSYLEKVKH